MRVLPFVVFIFLTLFGFAAFSDDLNTTITNHNIKSDNKTELPHGFRFLDKRGFDSLTLLTPEDLRLSQLFFPNSTLNNKFDWFKWLESEGNVKSRTLLGGFPFMTMRVEDGEESPSFSTHNFFFLLYFNKKF
jgi:hypothetical protein